MIKSDVCYHCDKNINSFREFFENRYCWCYCPDCSMSIWKEHKHQTIIKEFTEACQDMPVELKSQVAFLMTEEQRSMFDGFHDMINFITWYEDNLDKKGFGFTNYDRERYQVAKGLS